MQPDFFLYFKLHYHSAMKVLSVPSRSLPFLVMKENNTNNRLAVSIYIEYTSYLLDKVVEP